ncbi:hypothetical protein [Iningainema tapete]|uniref:Uncharacterized protein n=1 Tax=Iningainema tapete BLCC-T55 TaxID=2748662 RepID=A0A8J6XDE4_9CYAN|nr:hypothetical protein [Iningainema tapete]MBD2773199.1 hypothetical protein [Iningainema tapete BLCC-T55]
MRVYIALVWLKQLDKTRQKLKVKRQKKEILNLSYFLFFTFYFLLFKPALAQVGYRSSDGYYYIRGLENNKTYQVDFGGMPLLRAATSNKCGILQFKPSKNFQPGDKFEIIDEKASITYGFIFAPGLSKKETPKCENQIVTQKEIWVTSTKFIAISGLTPSSAVTIKLLSQNKSKNLRANLCGFITIKLDSIVPSAFITEGKAYSTNSKPERGIACRKGMLYVSYPPPTPINPIPEDTWKQQNIAPNFSPETQMLANNGSSGSGGNTSGGGTSGTSGSGSGSGSSSGTGGGSSGTGSGSSTGSAGTGSGSGTGSGNSGTGGTSGGTGGSTGSGTGGTSGGTGGSTSGGTGSGGNTGGSTGSGTGASGGSGTGGTSGGTSPQPPAGQKFCKVGFSQLLVTGLAANKKHYAATPEDDVYNEVISSSDGYALFSNIDYNDKWSGDSAQIEIGTINPNKAEWENREPIGAMYVKKLNTIVPCQ